MLLKTEKRMRPYFNLVDFWAAAALYFGFNCVNYHQGFTVLPFLGGDKAVVLLQRDCSRKGAEDGIDCSLLCL